MLERITLLVTFWLALGFVLAYAQNRDQPPSPVRPLEGSDIFQDFCASCHGRDGRGKGPVSRDLKQAVPDLTKLSRQNGGTFPASRVRSKLMFGGDQPSPAHGSKAMPVWGPIFHQIEFDQDLGNVRLENVTRYLESIQRK
ncbi:MAG TPA: cytochrome c [Candidatus Sulfotelmatobacter sp.]|nr:cytochrome c [Candidatus Sulfotelmatobacter sp.]